jgi:anti-anti-sigma factor
MEPVQHGDLLVYKLAGDLPVNQLLLYKQEFAEAVRKKQSVALDMEDVLALNSNAIGLFMNASHKLQAAGQEMFIVAPPQEIYDIMTLVSLEEQIPIYVNRNAFLKEVVGKFKKEKK